MRGDIQESMLQENWLAGGWLGTRLAGWFRQGATFRGIKVIHSKRNSARIRRSTTKGGQTRQDENLGLWRRSSQLQWKLTAYLNTVTAVARTAQSLPQIIVNVQAEILFGCQVDYFTTHRSTTTGSARPITTIRICHVVRAPMNCGSI